MHVSTASLHEYIHHRNLIMSEELLVVLGHTDNYIKETLGFSEMQDSPCPAKGKVICSVSFENLAIFTSVLCN